MIRKIAALLLLCLGAPAAATEMPTPDAFPVCYDFGCRTRQIVTLSPEEWREVAGWFVPTPANAAAEREQIRRAVGWMEVLVGRHTPTHLDKGRNDLIPTQAPGQLDCIDESTNATTYLRLLERQGLLRFHRVLDRAYRRALLDQHWAGQIEDLATGERFVVDSWFADNGSLPYIQSLDKWLDIPFFGTSFDATF
jgi:hypothetical protein